MRMRKLRELKESVARAMLEAKLIKDKDETSLAASGDTTGVPWCHWMPAAVTISPYPVKLRLQSVNHQMKGLLVKLLIFLLNC